MDPSAFPTLDPELAPLVARLPAPSEEPEDLAQVRTALHHLAESATADLTGLVVEDVGLEAFGSPATARVYRPAGVSSAPGLLYLHGGGFFLGGVDLEHPLCARLARELAAVVVSVDYRLAPEHPYPAGLEDCYSGLRLLAALDGVDPDRLVVHGQSAGGGLAAAVALLARDRGGPALCFQALGVPELDDRLETPSMRPGFAAPTWSRAQAERSWRHYLGGAPADQYAAPARAADLSGLPPAYVVTCELDPLRDEGLDYAVRLLRAGVSVELHSFPGTFHGVQWAQGTEVVRRMDEELLTVLRRAMRTPG